MRKVKSKSSLLKMKNDNLMPADKRNIHGRDKDILF